MPCFVPFHGRNLETSFFVFKPVGVLVEDLLHALKYFSFCAEYHGCAYSSVFQSIHGNLIIWYGAWMKRSTEKRELLSATLKSALVHVSSLAILLDYGFFEPYAGESKEGLQMARFSTGDTITMNSMLPASDDLTDLSCACLALLKSCFLKMDGVRSGVCLRCHDRPRVAGLYVWKSLHACYSWLLTSNFRNTISPYIGHLSVDTKYDVFRVVYVSCDEFVNLKFLPPHILAIGGDEAAKELDPVQSMQF
ncbi:hypothetical protein ACLOJK_021488 [Asimina triloba]